MKKFVLKSIVISLPIIFLFILMEFFLRSIPNDYSYKKKYLDKNASEIETLILGSSHAYYGIDPLCFTSKTFNASHISQTFDYDFKIFQKYQPNFKNLKTIVLPISYSSLFGKLELGLEAWRVKNYIIYYKFNNWNTISDYSEIFSHPFIKNKERLFSYYEDGDSVITCSQLGWGERNLSIVQEDLYETGKTAAIRHTRIDLADKIVQNNFYENKLILKEIINQCKQKNINIIFLTTPAFESYRANLNKKQLNLTINTAKNLDIENENVIYLNFLDDSRFVSEDFQDADHLANKGADKLSKIINSEIEKLK